MGFVPENFFDDNGFQAPTDVLAKFGNDIQSKSGGLIRYRIRTSTRPQFFELRFFLVAAYADDFAIDIFTVRHTGEFYPCGVVWLQGQQPDDYFLELGNGNQIVCNVPCSNEQDLTNALLAEVGKEYFVKILKGLYSMSKTSAEQKT